MAETMTTGKVNSSGSELAELLSGIDREITGELQEQSEAAEFGSGQAVGEDIGRHICFHLADRHMAIPLSLVLEVGELEIIRHLRLVSFLPLFF